MISSFQKLCFAFWRLLCVKCSYRPRKKKHSLQSAGEMQVSREGRKEMPAKGADLHTLKLLP